jgi:hypothetical protein
VQDLVGCRALRSGCVGRFAEVDLVSLHRYVGHPGVLFAFVAAVGDDLDTEEDGMSEVVWPCLGSPEGGSEVLAIR